MRYRLHTLLILATIGPLILAWGWWEYSKYVERKQNAELWKNVKGTPPPPYSPSNPTSLQPTSED